jgi:hypothetical protein
MTVGAQTRASSVEGEHLSKELFEQHMLLQSEPFQHHISVVGHRKK